MVYTLIDVLSLVMKVYSMIILGRVIMSWVNPDPGNALVQIIYRITEPVLGPVRNFLPAMGGMDFSPIVVLIGLQIGESLVVRALLSLAEG